MKNRHFKFTFRKEEDFCLANNLFHAVLVFQHYYPNVRGTVAEVWMDEYGESKTIKDRIRKVITIN